MAAVSLLTLGAALLAPVSAQAEETAPDTTSVDHMVATVHVENYTDGFKKVISKES